MAVSSISAADINDTQVTGDDSLIIENSDDSVESQVDLSAAQSEDDSFDISQETNSISKSDSNDVLKASSDDEKLGGYDSNGIYYDDNPTISSVIVNAKDSYEVGDKVTLKLGSELNSYDYGSNSIVYVRLDGEQDRSKWVNVGTYGTLKTTGVEYTMTESGSHAIQLILNSYMNYWFSKATNKVVINKAKTETALTLTGNGATEVQIKPGGSVRFVVTMNPSVSSARINLFYGDVQQSGVLRPNSPNNVMTRYFYDEGTYLVTAYYAGDDDYKSATSNVVKVVVGKADATLTVTPETAKIYLGDSVTIKGTVTPSAAAVASTRAGIIRYDFDDLTESVTLNSGVSFDYTPKSAGTHIVNVTYLGNDDYKSTSKLVTIEVLP